MAANDSSVPGTNVLGAADIAGRMAGSPFTAWLGVNVASLDDERLRVRLDLREDLVGSQFSRHPHGGVIASLIDLVACYTIIARTGTAVATVDLSVTYLRPAGGDVVFGEGRVVKIGKRLSVAMVEVRDGADRLLATGKVIVSPIDA